MPLYFFVFVFFLESNISWLLIIIGKKVKKKKKNWPIIVRAKKKKRYMDFFPLLVSITICVYESNQGVWLIIIATMS